MGEFCLHYPEIANRWHYSSNTLVALSVQDEAEIIYLSKKATSLKLIHYVFFEPDLDNQATSITIQPSKKTKQLVNKYNLL